MTYVNLADIEGASRGDDMKTDGLRCQKSALMRQIALTLCVLASLWAHSAAAGLVTIVSTSFSVPQAGLIGLTPFDPTLGTLDSVNVTINGQLTVLGSTTPQLAGVPPAPQPYPYQINVTQDFDGLGGQFFSFNNAAVFSLQGLALGAGESFQLFSAFSYGFTLNSATDLSGVVFPTFSGLLVPPIISGTRADFLKTDGGANQIFASHTAVATIGPVSPTLVLASGALIVQYNYTPAQAVEVGEPGALALLGIAFGGLAFTRRRRGENQSRQGPAAAKARAA